jgi:restriction endonuclease S subunit
MYQINILLFYLKKVDFYEEENDYVSIIKDGAGVGRIVYCKGKSSVLGTMEIIKPKVEVNTYFLYCLLENIDFTKFSNQMSFDQLNKYKHGHLNVDDIYFYYKAFNYVTGYIIFCFGYDSSDIKKGL